MYLLALTMPTFDLQPWMCLNTWVSAAHHQSYWLERSHTTLRPFSDFDLNAGCCLLYSVISFAQKFTSSPTSLVQCYGGSVKSVESPLLEPRGPIGDAELCRSCSSKHLGSLCLFFLSGPLSLKVTFGIGYPDELPVLEIPMRGQVISEAEHQLLIQHLVSVVGTLGIMISDCSLLGRVPADLSRLRHPDPPRPRHPDLPRPRHPDPPRPRHLDPSGLISPMLHLNNWVITLNWNLHRGWYMSPWHHHHLDC